MQNSRPGHRGLTVTTNPAKSTRCVNLTALITTAWYLPGANLLSECRFSRITYKLNPSESKCKCSMIKVVRNRTTLSHKKFKWHSGSQELLKKWKQYVKSLSHSPCLLLMKMTSSGIFLKFLRKENPAASKTNYSRFRLFFRIISLFEVFLYTYYSVTPWGWG